MAKPPSGETPEQQRQQLLTDLARFERRLDGYASALAQARPDDPMPAAVRPLFHRISFPPSTPPAERHFTPDFLVPFVIDNQLEQLASFYSFQAGTFFRYVLEEMKRVAETTGEVIHDASEGVATGLFGDGLKWVVGGAVVVALGSAVYLASRR